MNELKQSRWLKPALVPILAIAGLLSVGVAQARGAVISLEAVLDGLHARPSTLVPNDGMATATVDSITGAFVISGTSATGSPVSDVEIRGPISLPAEPLGAVILPLSFAETTSPNSVFSGSGTLTPSQLTELLAGDFFVAVNTANFQGPQASLGGSLIVVPELSGWAGMCLSAFSLLCMRLRRKKFCVI